MRQGIVAGVTAVVSLAAGLSAGYLFAKHQLRTAFDQQLKEEIQQTKEFYARLYKKDEFETPEEAVEALVPEAADALRKYQGISPAPSVSEEHRKQAQETLRNIFKTKEKTDTTIPEKEKQQRTEEAPFILEKDEFDEGELEYTQSTLTYYAGDGILTDARDDIIEEVDKTIGDNNVERFGYGSGDPNVLYVRNDVLEIDFEVLRHEGTYKKHVAGLDD
jgi:hypothetical protein